MPHRLLGLNDVYLYLAGAGTYAVSRIALWAQAATAAVPTIEPGSMTDVVGSGGLTVTTAGAVITGFRTLQYLVPLILDHLRSSLNDRKAARDDRKAAREERDRIRQEAKAVRDHDAKLASLQAEVERVRRESAEERDRIRQEAAGQVEEAKRQAADELLKYREIRHKRDDDLGAQISQIELKVDQAHAEANQAQAAVIQFVERHSSDEHPPYLGPPLDRPSGEGYPAVPDNSQPPSTG